jgi:hypothetical protein
MISEIAATVRRLIAEDRLRLLPQGVALSRGHYARVFAREINWFNAGAGLLQTGLSVPGKTVARHIA